jgi:hypothetical protein
MQLMKKLTQLLILALVVTWFQFPTAEASRVYTSGFEWQDVSMETSVAGGALATTTRAHSGSSSAAISGSVGAGSLVAVAHNVPMGTDVYARFYVYFDSITNTAGAATVVATIDLLSAAGAANAMAVQVDNNAGTLNTTIYYNAFASTIDDTAVFTLDTWHLVEIDYKSSGAGATDRISMKLDGTLVASSSALTLTSTPGYWQAGIYNGTAGAVTDNVMYVDDVGFNTTAGTYNTSWLGEGKVAILVPNAAGSSTCTAGLYTAVNEVPPSDTATTGGGNTCELDANPTTGYFNLTTSSNAGIDSYDNVKLTWALARVREESAGTSNYTLRSIESNGAAASTTPSRDAGSATALTNPSSTTAFGSPLILERSPSTGAAWTPTLLDSLQIGAGTTDGTPDTWINTLAMMVEYTDGTAPATGNVFNSRIIVAGKSTFAGKMIFR